MPSATRSSCPSPGRVRSLRLPLAVVTASRYQRILYLLPPIMGPERSLPGDLHRSDGEREVVLSQCGDHTLQNNTMGSLAVPMGVQRGPPWIDPARDNRNRISRSRPRNVACQGQIIVPSYLL